MYPEIANTQSELLFSKEGWHSYAIMNYPGRRKLYFNSDLRLVELASGEYRRYKNGLLTFTSKRLNARALRRLLKRWSRQLNDKKENDKVT